MGINIISLLWFVLGSTANFQRSPDIISSVVIMIYGIPSIILLSFSILLIKKGVIGSKWISFGILILIVLLMFFSFNLYKNVKLEGWLVDKVIVDTTQITPDGRYEYNLEFINLFQKNSYARVYLKDTSSHAEVRIKLDIETNKIHAIGLPNVRYWIKLEHLDVSDKYKLITKIPALPEETFELDLIAGKIIKRGDS